MAYNTLLPFDRPLAGAAIPGQTARVYTQAELAARDVAAYHRGADEARASADQQMVEFRVDIEKLRDGVFKKISELEPNLLAQLRSALPLLALDIAHRLLAGYEPPPEVVSKLCAEALEELFPERENLELVMGPRDAALLEELKPGWISCYPGLRIRTEASFSPGDCQVRSRFGLTDARRLTKLSALQQSLIPA